MASWRCRIKISVAGIGRADAEFCWEGGPLPECCFNTAGLRKAIAIRKGAGSSNHWKVLKSALLRATPTQLITRVTHWPCSSMIAQGPSLLFPPKGVMKWEFWTLCCNYEQGWKFSVKGHVYLNVSFSTGNLISFFLLSFLPSPTHNTQIPSGEQMYLFLGGEHHRVDSHGSLGTATEFI